jgi:hypothetical protein
MGPDGRPESRHTAHGDLLEMLGEPGSAADVGPHFVLHGVGNYPLVFGDEAMRKAFSLAIGGDRRRAAALG